MQARLVIPLYVLVVIQTLQKAGKRVYVVGGAVRDHFLHRPVEDYDLATDALPKEVIALFSDSIQAGAGFGIVGVRCGSHVVHVGTLRKDGEYVSARYPKKVAFTDSIEADLARRDFTINAMAYDLQTNQLIDSYNGQADIQTKILRMVGDPAVRLREDTLRIFRAFRFKAQLGFQFDQALQKAISELDTFPLPPAKRVAEEMTKLNAGPFADAVLKEPFFQDRRYL